MLESQTRELDGRNYAVTQLDEKTARLTFLRLAKLLGPSLAELAKGLTAGNLSDLTLESVTGAVARLLYGMSEEDLEYFCTVMRKTTKVQLSPELGFAQLTDGMFRGKLASMFKWLVFALEVNFSDFLDALQGMKMPPSSGAKAPIEAASQSSSLPE